MQKQLHRHRFCKQILMRYANLQHFPVIFGQTKLIKQTAKKRCNLSAKQKFMVRDVDD
eukprot:UN20129